jgi:hypothetical protein
VYWTTSVPKRFAIRFRSLEKLIQRATRSTNAPGHRTLSQVFHVIAVKGIVTSRSWWRDVTDWLRQFNSANIRHVVFCCTTAQNTIRFIHYIIVYAKFSSISRGSYWALWIIKSKYQNMYESSPWIKLITLQESCKDLPICGRGLSSILLRRK